MHTIKNAIVTLLLIFVCQTLPAQNKKDSTLQLPTVIVKARKGMNDKGNSLGKINIDPMDLPQSVAIISKAILERQQVLNISDAL